MPLPMVPLVPSAVVQSNRVCVSMVHLYHSLVGKAHCTLRKSPTGQAATARVIENTTHLVQHVNTNAHIDRIPLPDVTDQTRAQVIMINTPVYTYNYTDMSPFKGKLP